jgi:cytosine deaminase
MLVDDAGDPMLRTTEMLAEQLIAHDLVGRGVACHARAVGTYEEPSVLRLARLARAAGLGFVSDPHTGPLHLPVETFLAEGLAVALGQDDIEDAYYPWGRQNMLEVAFLAGHVLGFLSQVQQRTLLEMVTTRAAAALGITDYGLEAGRPADFCIHPHERVVDVLREHEAPWRVYRDGRLVAETTPATTTFSGRAQDGGSPRRR